MEKLKHFFWLCSGVHLAILKKCESEASKYVGIGATVFFTGVFAAMAAAYALYTVFDNYWIASALGLVWGFMIFNLDRYIVSSMRKEGNSKREFLTALPRIILAVIISLVIAKPLELKIFEKEIQAELVMMEQQTYAAQEGETKLRFQSDREKLIGEIAILKNEIENKTTSRNELDRQAREEADGTGGSKRRNAGPIYKLKKADADQAAIELDQLVKRNTQLIDDKLAMLAESDSAVASEIANLDKQKLDGPASRMEALSRIAAQSSAIWWANWFILLLFIAVETAPVFVKLISPQGPYDHLLKIEEHGFEGQRIESLAKTNADIKNRTKDLPSTESGFVNDRLDVILNKS
ncbi:MAG TPA: DUF4407 domain-containing protein [Cyclobacteriaceae bacterium]|nr:DUF4407 domain-containing protein [Cyclobacteriaceae bacterium]